MSTNRAPQAPTIQLEDLARSYLRQRTTIEWMDWLPLAEAAWAHPERWIEVWRGLSLEAQYDFTDLFKNPNAGPLADVLLLLLANSIEQIEDEQLRQYILEDGAAARARQGQKLQALRDRIEPLSMRNAHIAARFVEGFELGKELNRLERELAEFRRREHDQDGAYARVNSLEREILKLETRKRLLEHYDEPARRGVLEQLTADIEKLNQNKRGLEQHIATATAQLERAKSETAEVEGRLKRLQADEAQAEARTAAAGQSLQELSRKIEQHRAEEVRVNAEQRKIAEAIDKLARSNTEKGQRLLEERSRFKELQDAAARAGMSALEQKIREVYAQLPPDKADAAFSRPEGK